MGKAIIPSDLLFTEKGRYYLFTWQEKSRVVESDMTLAMEDLYVDLNKMFLEQAEKGKYHFSCIGKDEADYIVGKENE